MQTWQETVEPYRQRRQAWIAHIESAESQAASDYFRKALFMTDVCALTVNEIIRSSATLGPREQTQHPPMPRGGVQGFNALCGLIQTLAAQPTHSAADALRASALQWKALGAMTPFWVESLNDLLVSSNRATFFERIERLVACGAGKVPVLGDFLSLWKSVLDAYVQKRRTQHNPGLYFSSIGSYMDATNVYVFGALAFCEEVERLQSGQAPCAQEDIKERIRRHMTQVSQHLRALAGQPKS